MITPRRLAIGALGLVLSTQPVHSQAGPHSRGFQLDAEVLPAAVANDERKRDAARFLETDSAAGVYQS